MGSVSVAACCALGIEFVSLSEQVDTSTPTGKMIFTVLGAVGLRRLRLRRLWNVSEQFYLAATAQNLKRLVRFLVKRESAPVPCSA